MAITFVGAQTSSQAGRTTDWPALTFNLTGGLASTPAADDLVLVLYSIGAQTGRTPTPSVITSGYTAGTQLNASGVGFNSRTNYFYKRMGSTPDTTITLSQTGNIADAGAALILVFRGVDATTPIDVTPTTMTGTGTTSGANKPNPAAITPTTSGAWIVALGAQAVGTGVAFTAPTTGLDSGKFWSITQADSADCCVGGGYYSAWTSGSHDIDIFNGGVSNSNNAQVCYTIALRPAGGAATATPTAGAVTVAGFAPTVTAAQAVSVTPSAGAVTVEGYAPTATAGSSSPATAEPTAGAVTVTGLVPTVGGGASATPTQGAVTVTGLAPTATAAATASPTRGAVTITGLAPTASAAASATPGAGAVTVGGAAPSASAAVAALPSLGAVTVAGFAPSVTVGGNASANPGTGVVTVTGFDSFAAAAASVTPQAGAVTIAGFAPSVSAGTSISATAEPGTGAISIEGFAPTVDAGELPPIRILRGDDGGEPIKRSFYERQLKAFEEELEQIVKATRKRRKAAVAKAVEAFEPVQAAIPQPDLEAASHAISEALQRLLEGRREVAIEMAIIEAHMQALFEAEQRRKRRNNEAALLLLL